MVFDTIKIAKLKKKTKKKPPATHRPPLMWVMLTALFCDPVVGVYVFLLRDSENLLFITLV